MKAAMNASGYSEASVSHGKGKQLEEVTIRPSQNGGFVVTEQFRRTREGKRAMSTPDWLPPEQPKTFASFDDLTKGLKECFQA